MAKCGDEETLPAGLIAYRPSLIRTYPHAERSISIPHTMQGCEPLGIEAGKLSDPQQDSPICRYAQIASLSCFFFWILMLAASRLERYAPRDNGNPLVVKTTSTPAPETTTSTHMSKRSHGFNLAPHTVKYDGPCYRDLDGQKIEPHDDTISLEEAQALRDSQCAEGLLCKELPTILRFSQWRCGHSVSSSDLAAGGTTLSSAVIEAFRGNADFDKLGKQYLEELHARDNEDGVKLQKGIQLAIDKGVLPAKVDVESTTEVFVDRKTPAEVTQEIIKILGDAPSKGCVMTLQGLSGIGKGTTVDMLKQKLPNAQTWSNGNIFRSLTVLAKTYAEQNNCSLEETLTADLLRQFLGYLSFDKYGDSFDIKIEGLGLKHMVSEVQNTVLKTVSKDIPKVAEKTQGEVITFIQDALTKMTAAGVNVLLEGRTQTLNYIRTPHRFELKLKDETLLGQRQAALIIGNEVKQDLGSNPDETAIKTALDKKVLEKLTPSRDRSRSLRR